MIRYNRVPVRFWVDSRGWEDKLRTFALYLYTCEHRTGEGLFRLPLAYAAADLGWTQPVAERQMDALVKRKRVSYDARAEVVLLPDALEIQVPKGNQVKGAIARLKALPATPLLADLYALSNGLSDDHSNALSKGLSNALSDAMRKALPMELERAFECSRPNHSNGHSNPRTLAHAQAQTPVD